MTRHVRVGQIALAVFLALANSLPGASPATRGTEPAPPVTEGNWLRPAPHAPAVPIWGHKAGLRVGLHPLRGPRGLLRIYAPYLGHPPERVINYLAIEPIPEGEHVRGLSELERSTLDGISGKRFWSVNDPRDAAPRDPLEPARGEVVRARGVESLRVFIPIERFDNGAHVYVRLSFRSDRPHEVAVATFLRPDSVALDHCIVTATMGNYARLRRLHLADEAVLAQQLWPDYRGDGFTPHARFPLERLKRAATGEATVSATTDEARPHAAEYAPGTRRHWRYEGEPAVQSWRCPDPDPRLEVWVNGRGMYWMSRAPIPGGISFENFEMVAPFRSGAEFIFSVEPANPPAVR